MATLNEKQAKLFTDRNWAVIATIREDGSPQATPVWIDYDGENVLVNSDPAEVSRPRRPTYPGAPPGSLGVSPRVAGRRGPAGRTNPRHRARGRWPRRRC